jgi:hypothetical protein
MEPMAQIRPNRREARVLPLGLLAAFLSLSPGTTPAQVEIDEEPILYSSIAADDPVARLDREIGEGRVRLLRRPDGGYLLPLLERLGIPLSSQALVFSKTSFQRNLISPETPRALYFADGIYLGYVRGGAVLEIASVDPRQGAIFYVLEQKEAERPRFIRQNAECLQCHASALTHGVPGLLVRSVYPDPRGQPVLKAGTFVTDHRSPLQERWGGWYVTGTHRPHTHLGNAVLEDEDHPERLDVLRGGNLADLRGVVETSPYPTPHSDVVALMVLEHQTQGQNLITSAGYQGRVALRDLKVLREMSGTAAGEVPDSIRRRFEHAAEPLLRYFLFCGEAPLRGRIRGTSSFEQEFAAKGPFDRNGRSLRQFDLTRRLFRHPLSYLIYSEALDALPAPVKDQFYRRLGEVLGGRDQSGEFSHLSGEDRRAILEILLDTREDLPASFSAAAGRREEL